jgi:Leucine-rich repeat (LRR) protein
LWAFPYTPPLSLLELEGKLKLSSPFLTRLDCADNYLTELDISNNTKLKHLSLYDNKFKFSTLPSLINDNNYLYHPKILLIVEKNHIQTL